jgi:hypothetical protein
LTVWIVFCKKPRHDTLRRGLLEPDPLALRTEQLGDLLDPNATIDEHREVLALLENGRTALLSVVEVRGTGTRHLEI